MHNSGKSEKKPVKEFEESRARKTKLEYVSQGITEHKKVQEELKQSKEFLLNTINALDDPFFVKDEQHRWVILNDAACEVMGRSREELIGKSDYDLFSKEQADVFWERDNRVFESGKTDVNEEKITWHGKLHTISTKKSVFTDSLTGKRFIAGTIRDITERKNAEKELRESEEKFRNLAEQTPNMVFIYKKGKVVYANEKCEKIMGYRKKEFYCPDFNFMVLVAPESRDLVKKSFSEHMQGNEVVPFEYTLLTKEGKRIEAIYTSKLIKYEGENAILGTVTDITELKKAERALRESEERFRKIFEEGPLGMALIDKNLKMVRVNRRLCEMLGYSETELAGLPFTEITHPSDISYDVELARQVFSGQMPTYQINRNFVKKDKTVLWAELTASAIHDENKQVIYGLGMIEDITERKIAEQKLLDDQAKLKSLASELSLAEERQRRHVATELHDRIGQSLVISKIKLDQLRKSVASCELNDALEEVSNCIEQVIQDTRTLTFDLSSPILYELGFEAAVAEWLTEQIQEKYGIETEFENDGHQKPLDEDIRVILFRNIRELLINVVKHAQAHKLKVTTRRVDKYIHVSVEDDGVGFDPVEVTSTAAKGAKFGLFSIRERLEQLGGLFKIESEPGRGSKITMIAPLKYEGTEGTKA